MDVLDPAFSRGDELDDFFKTVWALDFRDLMISAAWETRELQYEHFLTDSSFYGKLAENPNYIIPITGTKNTKFLNYKCKAYCFLSHF